MITVALSVLSSPQYSTVVQYSTAFLVLLKELTTTTMEWLHGITLK